MARHLVNGVAVGWEELGTDLLNGAPPEIVTALTGGERWSQQRPGSSDHARRLPADPHGGHQEDRR
ncbi:hypothetical protein RKD23_001104 [Streptomyces sp. SAI-170]|uniref:hypothetical protein n=1 Tax=Streptomyces sp. SAI-170 TaxID=3377729 RepID=UPI003C7D3495